MKPLTLLLVDRTSGRITSGARTDLLEDIDRLQGPLEPRSMSTMRARIGAEVDLIVEWNRDAWRAARVETEHALRHLDRELDDIGAALAAIIEGLEHGEPVRYLTLGILIASVVTCLGAEYAWTVNTFPFLLDLASGSVFAKIMSALPVAAATAIEWALAVMAIDRIRGFRASLHAGRIANRMVAVAGAIGVAAVGLAVLAMNIELVMQLGAVRAIAQSIGTDLTQSAESLARAQAVIDLAVKVLGVVVAVDTAVLLMATDQELRVALRLLQLTARRWGTERHRRVARAAQRDAAVRHEHAKHLDEIGPDRARTVGNEFRARALDRLERRSESQKPKPPTTLEALADSRLATPPSRERAGASAAPSIRVH